MVVLYSILGIMETWVFLAKITQKPASQLHHGTLAVFVRYNQAQKSLQYNPKSFQYIVTKLFKKNHSMEFSTACLPAFLSACLPVCLMPSGKHNLITAKAMGLIFSLFDVTSSQDVPFGIPQYIQCIRHGLTFFLLCVPFFLLTAKGVDLR